LNIFYVLSKAPKRHASSLYVTNQFSKIKTKSLCEREAPVSQRLMGSTWLSKFCQRLFSKHCIFLLSSCVRIAGQDAKIPAHRAPQSHRLDFGFSKKTGVQFNEKQDSSKKHPPGNPFPNPFFFQNKSKKRKKRGTPIKL